MTFETARAPKARRTRLLVEQVGDETIVYDEIRQAAHSLNRTASAVFRHCDGTRSVPQLAAMVATELGGDADEAMVRYALERLARAHLIDVGSSDDDEHVTRRTVVRRLALAGGATIAIPAVLSIVAPTPAMAASTPEPPPDPGPD
jgi:Coenzyme PQQ synthesis protein D (PqqD)